MISTAETSLGLGPHCGVAAAGDETLDLPSGAPRVVGYLRFLPGSSSPLLDDVLRATAANRGYRLVSVIQSSDVSTLAGGCAGINQVMRLLEQREVDGVLTLADYTIAWDREVVRYITTRIHQYSGFLDFVWPHPQLPHRRQPAYLNRNPR
jgi:hypothetical protein